jgi:hypothetical protein
MFVLFFAFLFVLILLVKFFITHWTSYDTGAEKRYYQPKLDFIKPPDFYGEETRKEHWSKENPHFDALVDAEWQAKQLEESALPEERSDEVRPLSDLLDEKKQR